MSYLETLGFSLEQINSIENNNPQMLINKINQKQKLIKINLFFLRDLGVDNYKEIFVNYAEFFLQEPSIFKDIFLKYDRLDLIEKLKKNMAIIIRL